MENQRLELEVRLLREQMARLSQPRGALGPPGSLDDGPSTSGDRLVSEIEIKPLNFLVDQFVCLGGCWARPEKGDEVFVCYVLNSACRLPLERVMREAAGLLT